MAQPAVIIYSSADVDKVPMLPDNNTFTGTNIFSGQVSFTGGVLRTYVAKTATYAAGTTDYVIDCTSGTFTVTLPTSVGMQGKVYNIKNSGTGTITVATTSSQTIDADTTKTLLQWDNLQIVSTGVNWIIQ